jgi:hypothetical protein
MLAFEISEKHRLARLDMRNYLGVTDAIGIAFLLCWFSARMRLGARHFEGMIVKRYVLAAALSLLVGGAVQAAAIDLDNNHAAVRVHRIPDLSPVLRTDVVAPPAPSMSELPEPEVFAMMLVGLILIGYRASRDSSEKFENKTGE